MSYLYNEKKPPKKGYPNSVVGMTGFEPATPRPPGVYATRLRYIPIFVQDIFFNSKNYYKILTFN